jgi:hypothetical protein
MDIPRQIQLVRKGCRTPRDIHKYVKQLIEKIGAGTTPVWVDIRPTRAARISECFINVPNHIQKHMGGMQYGWTIWQVANLFVEAEFHAVWVSPQGQYLDITPKPERDTRILFLPDDSRKWEDKLVPNIRVPMIDGPEIQEFFKAVDERNAYREANWTPDGIPTQKHIEDMEAFSMNEGRLMCQMAMTYIPPPNKPCPCESGRQFGNCCGKL